MSTTYRWSRGRTNRKRLRTIVSFPASPNFPLQQKRQNDGKTIFVSFPASRILRSNRKDKMTEKRFLSVFRRPEIFPLNIENKNERTPLAQLRGPEVQVKGFKLSITQREKEPRQEERKMICHFSGFPNLPLNTKDKITGGNCQFPGFPNKGMDPRQLRRGRFRAKH